MSKYQLAQKTACYIGGKENEGLEECKRCKISKWKDKSKKQYAKILCYFPLKSRLQRLFVF